MKNILVLIAIILLVIASFWLTNIILESDLPLFWKYILLR